MKNYQMSHYGSLKSTGMWTLIAIAISACCVAVATSRGQPAGKNKAFRERKKTLKPLPRSEAIEAPRRCFRKLVRQLLRYLKFQPEAARPKPDPSARTLI